MKAIILAAGLGSRFKEITKTTHKALLPIQGEPNLERTIKFLKEANVQDIYIVTGHLKQSFEYLIDKYQVNLIFNEKYKDYNSIYSMYKALDVLGDSFVIDSDVVLFKNIFLEKPKMSTYYTVLRENTYSKEWIPVVKNNKVTEIIISDMQAPSLLGISFWSNEDANLIKEQYQYYLNKEKLCESSLYWDNIPMSILDKLNITTSEVSKNSAFEMDNQDEYKFICQKLSNE